MRLARKSYHVLARRNMAMAWALPCHFLSQDARPGRNSAASVPADPETADAIPGSPSTSGPGGGRIATAERGTLVSMGGGRGARSEDGRDQGTDVVTCRSNAWTSFMFVELPTMLDTPTCPAPPTPSNVSAHWMQATVMRVVGVESRLGSARGRVPSGLRESVRDAAAAAVPGNPRSSQSLGGGGCRATQSALGVDAAAGDALRAADAAAEKLYMCPGIANMRGGDGEGTASATGFAGVIGFEGVRTASREPARPSGRHDVLAEPGEHGLGRGGHAVPSGFRHARRGARRQRVRLKRGDVQREASSTGSGRTPTCASARPRTPGLEAMLNGRAGGPLAHRYLSAGDFVTRWLRDSLRWWEARARRWNTRSCSPFAS